MVGYLPIGHNNFSYSEYLFAMWLCKLPHQEVNFSSQFALALWLSSTKRMQVLCDSGDLAYRGLAASILALLLLYDCHWKKPKNILDKMAAQTDMACLFT